jgi:hypothetical protein
LLVELHPDRYQPAQLRTLQRHIANWRALHGPEQVVIFEQLHSPGERAQSDFTHMEDLAITLNGQPFPHLLYHFVLTYSNVEAVRICFSETFEALAEGIEAALWQVGGVPQQHRTDHLSAAVRHLDRQAREDFTLRYQALMSHYGMRPTWNNTGISHENGDVEQSHFRFKGALDQALRVRANRDFKDRAAYEQFLADLVRKRNLTRQKRFEEERKMLRLLPALPLSPGRELKVSVSRFSTIQVLGNTYSVPSRLIGTDLTIRVRAESLEGYLGSTPTLTLPRLQGHHRHAINYRHVIWSLVRKPGAFAAYRYREEMFPSLAFRKAYDELQRKQPQSADREYLRVLHLAASSSEAEVETALALLAESGKAATFEGVRELVSPVVPRLPALTAPPLNLGQYDRLIPSQTQTQSGPKLDQNQNQCRPGPVPLRSSDSEKLRELELESENESERRIIGGN